MELSRLQEIYGPMGYTCPRKFIVYHYDKHGIIRRRELCAMIGRGGTVWTDERIIDRFKSLIEGDEGGKIIRIAEPLEEGPKPANIIYYVPEIEKAKKPNASVDLARDELLKCYQSCSDDEVKS
jgi:hypothetical protein